MQSVFSGAATALVTPFTAQGIHFAALERLVVWQIEAGIDALVLNGTTGEASTQTSEEKQSVVRCGVKAAAGKVPIIAGTGGNDTAKVIADSQKAADAGAAALLIVTPYYNKTTPAGLLAHYAAICAAVPLPVIVYNVPSRTNMNITSAIMQKLADIPGIVGIKEASGDIKQIGDTARLCAGRIAVYSGNDDHVVPVLSVGGVGVITTVGNILPREMHDLCALWFAGDIQQSLAVQQRVNPLVDTLFSEVNPIPVKTALRLMGHEVGPLRLPLVDMQPDKQAAMEGEMRAQGLL